MSFTREQIKEIKEKLALLGSKDNNLPIANPLDGNETIAIIQDGNNRKVSIDNFYEQFENHTNKSKVDFFNVSVYAMNISGETEIADYTLDQAIDLCPEEVRKSGQIITFLDRNDNWQIWQFISSDPTNWNNVDECWKNLEDKIGLGIIFTSSKQNIVYNNIEDFQFHFETIDGGNVSSAILYVTDNLDINKYNKWSEVNNVSSHDFTVYNLTTTTKVKIVATQYGEIYEKEITLPFVRPAWIGSGSNSSSIQNDEHKFYVSDNAKNAYDITFDEPSYLIITLPKNVVLDPVTMNGFEVPLQEQASNETINGIAYRTYKSANQYIPGTHKFVIGVYSGGEHELMSSVLTSLNGLNELISNSNEVDAEHSNSIRNIESRVETLEDESYNTVDQEDLMVTYDHKYKFANKEFDKDNFSGKGRVYLRKNIQDIEFTQQNDPTITDPNTIVKRRMNVLTSTMIYNDNTIYIVQYDYDLQGNDDFQMPSGSGLQYAGGTFNNGTLDVTGCILLPGWENIIGENFTITGIPAVGSMYFNTEANMLYVSNGTNWIGISGEIINNNVPI